ncbi:MAG: hypothetical protein KIT33_02485 [Candidatus Kapabacteria bacterium]|nr:hypothetical protein [Ignavibacteriota bacterium]MCW5883817.1 hypothetical protein [Candidatus Kapabacteria bacterium]
MKQLKTRALLLSLVAILFAASTADSFAQLTKIWDRSNENLSFQWLCKKGKLAVVNGNNVLIDLSNGQTLFNVKMPEYIYLDNSGKRFFVSNNQDEVCKVYDRFTLEYIEDIQFRRYTDGYIAPDDSTRVEFVRQTHTLNFWNIYSNELKESYKIPNTPDEPAYSIAPGSVFSNDGRYLAFHFKRTSDAVQNNFLLYDRQTRELIMKMALPVNNFLVYQFFNKSNLMAYSENIKLPEDDKPYSYIRIYDPDKREVVKNIKMSNVENGVFYFLLNQNDNYFIYSLVPSNDKRFYDIVNDKKLDFVLSNIPGPFYLDDSLYVAGSFEGYKFDWNVVSVDDEPNPIIPVIYP